MAVLPLTSELACSSLMQCWSYTDQDIQFTRKLSDLFTEYYVLKWVCFAVILTPFYLNLQICYHMLEHSGSSLHSYWDSFDS